MEEGGGGEAGGEKSKAVRNKADMVFSTDGKDDALTWGSTLCSSCSYSCTGGGGGGSRPVCEQGCARWSEVVWEQPTVGAGRAPLPRRGWQAGWGRRRRLWAGTGLGTDMKTNQPGH